MKLRLPILLRKALLIATSSLGISAVSQSYAASYTGTSDWNWNTGTNWSGGTAPNAASAIAEFDTGSNSSLKDKIINIASDITIGQLLVSGPLSSSAHDKLTLSGSTITFDNGASDALLQIVNGIDLIVDSSLKLNSNLKIDNQSNHLGTITVNGGINLNGKNLIINVGASSAVTTIGGVLSGNGNLTKSGSGTLTLSGAGTFIGNVVFERGTIDIKSDAAFGASSNSISVNGNTGQTFNVDGSYTVANSMVLDTTAQQLNITGGGTLTFNNGGQERY